MVTSDWQDLVKMERDRADRMKNENDRLRRGLRDVRETINAILEDRR